MPGHSALHRGSLSCGHLAPHGAQPCHSPGPVLPLGVLEDSLHHRPTAEPAVPLGGTLMSSLTPCSKGRGAQKWQTFASCQQTRKETHATQGVREAPVSPRDRGGSTEAQGNGSGLGLFGLLLQVTLSSLWQHSIDAWLQGDLRACGCSWGPADSGRVAVQWAGLWGSRCTGGSREGAQAE